VSVRNLREQRWHAWQILRVHHHPMASTQWLGVFLGSAKRRSKLTTSATKSPSRIQGQAEGLNHFKLTIINARAQYWRILGKRWAMDHDWSHDLSPRRLKSANWAQCNFFYSQQRSSIQEA
jgi:hypothetical protein